MICTLSKHAAEAAGFDDALMLDWQGNVAESTGANIFFAIKDQLHTPTPNCFLDGITRQTIIKLARARNYDVVERTISPDELSFVEEVFLTGTAAEVTPVGQIAEHTYSVGKITKTLMQDYAETTHGGSSG